MDGTLWAEVAKNGIFAVAAAVIAWTLWKEMRRMSDEARAREERISTEAKTERERMHSEAIAREDRLMKLAEGLTDRFEALAGQYEGLAQDVHEIKSSINGKDVA
ncbi:hypothetical protein BSK66_08075 [Paenibacillus odorifer]|uniref:hypothetical protein n=1 Tax=Paenibacillus TaxID=44249 RepID=UPI0003E2178E|nr:MULTISPECIES: hypothetical protein [Paenibacillus]ETT64202.1 hypothetical protein C171_08097 [Paenibacillus sp. FSL H8-237]OME61078.1 hypothetical protein BSK66_08075 [Paenibacillus odorifer]